MENALDPLQAQSQLRAVVPKLRRVTTATLVRHKAGRRALVEYHLDTAAGTTAVLGKIRARGTDRASHQVQQDLWKTGWDAHSRDRLCVPEPLGLVPDWHMMLQRKVPGTPATQLLPTEQGISLAQRIAALAHKLHRTPISTAKTHTLADELSILRDRLPIVAAQHPQWSARIDRVLKACDRLATRFSDPSAKATHPPFHPSTLPPIHPPTPHSTIHRDFYADQILVDGDRLWLVDLDLCCQGSPAVDIGNFTAHITEQSLRELGNAEALRDRETALQTAYLSAVDGATGVSEAATGLQREIELYTVLTLVRHLHISTRIPSRRPYTEQLLELCETHLSQLKQSIKICGPS
nr:phosphotransferase [Nodosilinea sp. LEGE 06152]